MNGMRKSQIIDKIIKNDVCEAEGAIYSYSLIANESTAVISYKLPLYSIAIEMIDKDGNKTSAKTHDLFSDVGKALVFYRKLVDNLATPLNLPYILEDELQ